MLSVVSVVNADDSLIDEIIREGARRMLSAALEAEVNAHLTELTDQRDDRGRRLVMRNGYHQPRKVTTAAGTVEVKPPRVNDKQELLAFYDVPAERWVHLRTKSPIESTFSTVRLRTKVTRGASSRAAALAMVFMLVEPAQARWRAVNASHLVALDRAGADFERGRLIERPGERAA
ncbi:transposase [Streptomyces gamaensis]|uniref:Mutator family transposase n=1 Tax=Streptomyces gamaensis TaxID=1763542 RepID=A0ABW0YX21_9ACTN